MSATKQALPLSTIYPINTLMELTLNNNNNQEEVTTGTIYCTDEVSNTIVLKKSLIHTTLSSEITVINASVVTGRRIITAAAADEQQSQELEGNNKNNSEAASLPNVSRRMVEEREKRAIKLMEESFRHVNQQASPEGQKIFDKLLKACNEVSWKGESIIVLGEIRVDPPYTSNDCTLLMGVVGKGGGSGGLGGHSLERVKNIVAAAK
mmetsp:Transcript_11332/g.17317  ORF Transcript_11332/g.17317 Transcript_11332/m.17317 type:complete len:208 (+) Transcript_11332:215-838(+)